MTEMTRIGLGTYPMGGGYGRFDGAQMCATFEAAADHGVTHIDTAESYGVEEYLGPLLRGRRDGFFVATKVFPARPFSYAHLRSALEGSLRRLDTDHVDLFQLHGMENAVLDLPCTNPAELGASLTQLLASGLTRRVGVCNYSAADLTHLAAHVPLSTVQNVYNLYEYGHERELLARAAELDVGFVAHTTLAQGLLGDTIQANSVRADDDRRAVLPNFRGPRHAVHLQVAGRLRNWAEHRGHSLAQLAVAWALRSDAVRSVLVGAKSPEQVARVAAAGQWRLAPEEVAAIEALARPARAAVTDTA